MTPWCRESHSRSHLLLLPDSLPSARAVRGTEFPTSRPSRVTLARVSTERRSWAQNRPLGAAEDLVSLRPPDPQSGTAYSLALPQLKRPFSADSHPVSGVSSLALAPGSAPSPPSPLPVRTHLVVFAEISPHAGAVPTAHQDVVGEEVDARDRAGELARGGIVVVTEVGDYVVELEHLVAFVLPLEASVEGDLGHRAVGGRADGPGRVQTGRPGRTRQALAAGLALLARRAHGTRWPRLTGGPPRACLPGPAGLAFGALDEGGQGLHEAAVGRGGRAGCLGAPVGVADHAAGA